MVAAMKWALILAVWSCLLLARSACAQEYHGARVRPGDDVTLAIMCAGERSPNHVDICTAMVNVVARTAARRGISIGAQARAYSAVFRSDARPWLLELNAEGTRPEHWPRASWERYRPAWLAVLAHVRALLAGEVEPVCEGAEHFGGRMDSHRMGAWVRVCPWVDDRQLLWGKQ